MYEKLVKGEAVLSVIGLGYVGLPIALEFAKKIKVIGFDIRPDRIEMMKKGIDPSNELPPEAFHNTDILFTADPEDLKKAHFHIIAVPTPTNNHNLPDLTPVLRASETLGRVLKKGDYVVYESTVYPGCTEEDCIPVLEKFSGLKCGEEFKAGYSPERINELSIIFNRMNINTFEVLEAAGTKWNFLRFYPGLVGGHCIGVDPYYLLYKAKELGYHPQIIDSGRFVNDSMGRYIGKQTVKKIIAASKNAQGSRVLVMGITFKENVSDIRNSKVVDVIRELTDFGVLVDVVDPRASKEEVKHEYGIDLAEKPGNGYDAVIVAVSHTEYETLSEEDLEPLLAHRGIIVDVKGSLRGKIKNHQYWSL